MEGDQAKLRKMNRLGIRSAIYVTLIDSKIVALDRN